MLHSMTGHGQAVSEANGVRVAAELRSVNNRYFKLSIHGLDGLARLEKQIETLLRATIHRGSVHLSLKIQRPDCDTSRQINLTALESYCSQLDRFFDQRKIESRIPIGHLLQLPGVLSDRAATEADDSHDPWPTIKNAVTMAVEKFDHMRVTEGGAMAADFQVNCDGIAACADTMESRAPEVTRSYEQRLAERIQRLLEPHKTTVQPNDIACEVGVFAERSDISEEIVRLRSHIGQFHDVMDQTGPAGKKLEFVVQEMFREVNTIGSKANDSAISVQVIEAKSYIERLREMVQNVE